MKIISCAILISLVSAASITLESSRAKSNLLQPTVSAKSAKPALTDVDRLLIAVQKICPVSGDLLGSKGDPVKIKAGEQIAFLCCKDCLSKKIDDTHWTTIQKRIAKAQGICPIMRKPVDASMESMVVDGQKVFVCCPPCIDKIQADPKPSMKMVHEAYAKFVVAESEQTHMKAQEICPVSGEKLGTRGAPVKVKVGDEHAFLCCKNCTSKAIDAKHWTTVQENLAKAQSICPVMEKPVNSKMDSVVVNGRRIFVCCPPCVDKIKKSPDEYVAKLNRQIEKRESK